MRTLFAFSLFALLLGVGVVALIETDPGYVLVSYGNYTLETSLWVGLVLLTVALLLFYILLRIVLRLVGGQRSLASWLGNRRSEGAQRNTTRGVISYVEGNFARARRQLLRGARGGSAPLHNYLLAARASDYMEEPERLEEFLQSAVEADSDAALAADIIRAEASLRGGDNARARALLEEHRGNAGRHPRVLALLQQACEGQGDGDALLALLPDLRRHKQLSDEELARLERDVHRRRLQDATDAAGLEAAWHYVSPDLKRAPELVRLYVRRQIDLGEDAGAAKSVVRALKRGWDPELVRLYGLIGGDNVSGRLTQAERWLPDHPEDAQLLLCLGRLCLRDKLWGKARDYFESSYRAEPGAEVCAELGRLLLGLGEPKVAAAYYREGLSARESDLPELPLPDKIVADHHLLERVEN